MTANRNFKRRVRARAAKTGESYTTALRYFRPTPLGDVMPENHPTTLRLAVAQTTVYGDPRHPAKLRASGNELRQLMRQAHDAGARVVHFTEGATCFPNKYLMSVKGPDEVAEADWSRYQWDVLTEELASIAALARELKLWTVLGSVHRLTPPTRPHNSLYVISDRGTVATRYDERTLSTTKITYLYTPGSTPVTFKVDGFRFGCALGMDVHFPELFSEYERLDVDCVLLSHNTAGTEPDTTTTTEVRGHAAINKYWISFAVIADASPVVPSGVLTPAGDWAAQCRADGAPALTVATLHREHEVVPPTGRPTYRAYRHNARTAMADRAEPHPDTRSTVRTDF